MKPSSQGAGRAGRYGALLHAQVACVLAASAVVVLDGGGPTPAAAQAVVARQEAVLPAPTAAAASPAPPAEVTLAFGGDVHFEGGIASVLSRDPAAVFGDAAGPLAAADVAVVNLETAVSRRGKAAAGKEYAFRAPPTAFAAIRAAGVDVVTMANNHALDYGRAALLDALDGGAAAGVPVIGAGRDVDEAFRPYVTTVDGQRISVIGATQVLDASLQASWTATSRQPGLASAKDPARLLRAVREARQAGGLVAVYLHWGRESDRCPPPNAKRLAQALVAAGADVIVGTHAHLELAEGYLGGAYVHYGLGNLVWYSGTSPSKGGVLSLTVQGRTVTGSSWLPIRMRGAKPVAARPTDVGDAARSCAGLAARPRP